MKARIPIPMQNTDTPADVAAVILVGGKSRRFGSDKAHISLCGESIQDRIIRITRHVTTNIVLSGATTNQIRKADVPVLPDAFPGIGPIAGLHAALRNDLAPWILLVACDLPLITSDLLEKIVQARSAACQAVVPVTPDGRRHPVCALYHRSVSHLVTDNIHSQRYALHQLLGRIQYCEMSVPSELLTNINTPADLKQVEKLVTENKIL